MCDPASMFPTACIISIIVNVSQRPLVSYIAKLLNFLAALIPPRLKN